MPVRRFDQAGVLWPFFLRQKPTRHNRTPRRCREINGNHENRFRFAIGIPARWHGRLLEFDTKKRRTPARTAGADIIGYYVRGVLKGYQFIDYTFTGKTGQVLHIKLTSNHSGNYFNVLPPGNSGKALFVGSLEGDEWTGSLTADGAYTFRVYLMRNAARRGEQAQFTLALNIKNSVP